MTLTTQEIDRLIQNQHQDPFAILGPHAISAQGKLTWVVRAYLPNASDAWVVLPEERQEFAMQSVHDPHFFECELPIAELKNYQLRVRENGQDRYIHDPYSLRSAHLTDFDLCLFSQGNHPRIYEKMGAHPSILNGVSGVYFAVWAPNASHVSVIGDFNYWVGDKHPMQRRNSGVWELFIPELKPGDSYKYEITSAEGDIYEKADPYGFQQEIRPKTASIVTDLGTYTWHDQAWMEKRRNTDPLTQPISVYEVHLGSWLHAPSAEPYVYPDGMVSPVVPVAELKPGARFLNYRELADQLVPYVHELGFTHIELMPVAEHPFDGSWGYQVTGYYAVTSRYGTPQDFMYFVDQCHQHGIGVIVDWVPGHFPKDIHGLAYFDGTHLYEHADSRIGEHKQWGTLVFNYGRHEVRNFLAANALFWFEKYHIDGIRVDAVASMLYLNYNREEGEWVANQYGGQENLEAVDFIRQFNQLILSYYPGVLSIAEESTAWPMVSWPTYVGGLGFNFKWDMGWMHDVLDYFSMDPWFRQFHQNNVTFGMWYHYQENYVLAFSHDEVVHGKNNMLSKMPGDEWQKFANLRCLYAYMFAHPGKKTLFMSMEFGQWGEWNVWGDLEWHLLQYEPHRKLKDFMGDLNQLYRSEPALYDQDSGQGGFEWIDCSDNRHSVVSFLRRSATTDECIIAVCNFTPQPHSHYRIGVPKPGFYTELLNSDARKYGGSNMGNLGGKWTDEWTFHNRPYSLDLCLPPLAAVILKLDGVKTAEAYGTLEEDADESA